MYVVGMPEDAKNFLLWVVCLSVGIDAELGVLRNVMFNTKCLHSISQDNGAELELVDCSTANTGQLIRIGGFPGMSNTPGPFEFDSNDKCLSLEGFDSSNGVHLLIWDCLGQDNQLWSIVNGDLRGSFQLQLKSSGRCLTAEGGGTYMDQWDCLGTAAAPHQSWAIERVGTGAGGISFLSFFLLENLNSPGNCLRYKDASASSYALELVICNAFDPSQQIATSTTYADGNGYYGFQFLTSGSCFDVSGQSTANGASVGQWTCVNQDNQLWITDDYQDDDNSFRIQNEHSSKCLTSEGGGTYMDIWDCFPKASAPHQYWKQRNPFA